MRAVGMCLIVVVVEGRVIVFLQVIQSQVMLGCWSGSVEVVRQIRRRP